MAVVLQFDTLFASRQHTDRSLLIGLNGHHGLVSPSTFDKLTLLFGDGGSKSHGFTDP